MSDRQWMEEADGLATPLLADACVRHGVAPRVAPAGIRPLRPGDRVFGRALPARHHGSVDVILEALEEARPGDVFLFDNGGRTDEGCIGDLAALELRHAGIAGTVVWGLHRDSPELLRIGHPVFSYGSCPLGPTRLDPREPETLRSARLGAHLVTRDDFLLADDDGVLALPGDRIGELLRTAREIWTTERRQADLIRAGEGLRDQLRFAEFLKRRRQDPAHTLRAHLREIGGAIEE